MGDIDDNQPDMQKVLEEALKREIGGLLKKAGREFGAIIFKYILVFFVLFISISVLVILIFFMPSLSIKYAADSLKNVFVGSDSRVDASDWGSPFGDLTFEEVGGRITGHFGEDRGDHKHRGVDIAVPEGTALYAAVSGTVSNASETDTEGKHVYIDTEDGYKFMYMHMSEIAVSAGQSVSKGDYIGKSGNTGDSTGPHLHYQIFSPSGVGVCWAESAIWLVDPEPYLTAGSSGSGGDGENTGIELSPDEVDEFWYNARNVKANLDALYEAVSDMNNGIEYITKDNFTMILDKVITYSESVRRVANEYTYYHHLYKREQTYSYQKDTPKEDTDDNTGGTDAGTPMDDQVSAQGVTINDSSNTEDIVEREWEDDDGKHEIITTWKTTDIERDDEVGHVQNASPEDDPIFKISWEEIYTMAAMKSVVQNGQERNWETESKLEDVERPDINGIARLSEETVKQIINEFQFNIMYYFDPTSGDTMEGSSDTYASHSYTYDEMDKYAYTKSKEGENVEHGTEVAGETSNFDYYEYKKPAIAPAIATNAYTTIEYDYTEQGDGTAILAGRQVIIDGQKFYNHVREILGEDFDLEWFVQFLSMLPGVNYDAGNGDLQTRFDQILTSYKNGEPYSYYDSDFDGVGKVILGSECSREPKISTRRDAEGNPIDIPEYNITITIDDISDEQIKADIEAGLYTMEDLVFMAACAQAEAGSVEGQVAVSWLLRNRLRLGTLASKEGTVKKVVPVTVKEKGEIPDVPMDTSGYTVAVSNREQLKGLETGETRKAEFVLKDKNGNVVEGAEFVYEADGVYASINEDGMLTAIKAGTAVVNVTAYVNGKKVCEKNVYVSVQVGTGDKKEDVSPSPSPSPSDDPGEADDPAVSPSPKPSRKPASDAAKPSGGTEKAVYVKRIGLSAEVSQIAYTGKLQVNAKIYPDNANNKNVSWTSSNPKWASVDKDGVVKAKKAGKGKSVIITCKALDGSGSSASYTVSITKGAVKKLKITQKENRKTLNIGKKLKLEPKFTFSGNKKDVIKKVAWSSSNEEWASVGKNGVVKAYEEGLGHTVTITARALDMSGKTASYKIRIVKSVVTDIKVSTDSKREVYAGDKIRLKTDLTWTGREKDVDKSIVWSSSNEEWATVNDKGVVTTKKAGGGHTVVISAAAKSGVTGTFKVKILASKVTGVTITPVKANTIKAGTKLRLKTTVKTSAKYEDANTKLKWSSSDPKVATVSKNGVVKAKKAGRVTITASSTDGSRVKAKIKLKVIKK